LSQCVKVDTLGRLCDDDLERSYIHFTTTNIYFIGAAYNFYFLIIYKPSTLIISPRTFSTQLGAGTAQFCLSQCAIPFCTFSTRRPFFILPPYPQWAFPIFVLFLPALEALNLCYSHSSYHPLSFSTLHYSTFQYFKFILGNDGPLFLPSLIPAVSGQVPKLLTASTQLPLPFF